MSNEKERSSLAFMFWGKTFGQFCIFFGMNWVFEVDIRFWIFVQDYDGISQDIVTVN